MPSTDLKLDQGQRVRVDAPDAPEFATVRFVTPPDADGVTTVFLVGDAGDMHEVHVGPGQDATVRALIETRLVAVERDEFLAAVTGHAPSVEAAGAVVAARLGMRPNLGPL